MLSIIIITTDSQVPRTRPRLYMHNRQLAPARERPESARGDYWRLPQVRRQPFAHMERLFSLDFDLIASWTWRADRSEGEPVFRLGGRNPHDQVHIHNHCTDVVAAPRTDSERAKHEAGVNN